jgi:hypothetical protein
MTSRDYSRTVYCCIIQIQGSNHVANISWFYNTSYYLPAIPGLFTIQIIANDTLNNRNITQTTTFTSTDITTPDVFDLKPIAGTNVVGIAPIEISANATDNAAVDTVRINLTYPNGTVINLPLTNTVGEKYNTSFTNDGIAGTYSIQFIGNDTDGNVNSTETTFFTVSNDLGFNITSLTYVTFPEDTYNDTIDLAPFTTYTGNTANLAWSCVNDQPDVSSTIHSTSLINISSANDFNGIVNVTCQVTDTVELNISTFQVNITPVNDAPVITFTNITLNHNQNTTLQLVDYTTDVDNTVPADMTWFVISENTTEMDCTVVGDELQVFAKNVTTIGSCDIRVTDSLLNSTDTLYADIFIPTLNITETATGFEWSTVSWDGIGCPI